MAPRLMVIRWLSGALTVAVLVVAVWVVAGLAGFGGVQAAEPELPPDRDSTPINERCLRCHGMPTLGYQDQATGQVVSLAVDAGRFADSNHSRMACTSCHKGEYREFPHDVERPNRGTLTCLGCHKAGSKSRFRVSNFDEIGRQFRRSVHAKALPESFDCFSCHDPHVFDVGVPEDAKAKTSAATSVVSAGNTVCLKCHDFETRFSAMTDKAFPNLKQAHEWLPNPRMHWRSVRCIECHTPRGDENVSHEIVRGGAVERNCVACHSKDSILLSRLYKHRAREERQTSGLLGRMLNNEAYIIGMTRSPEIDALSALLVGGTILGLGGHGFLRWRAWRRRRT
ncbi:MAG: nitrate reductase [Alphaproteobacteria bacterium]